MLYLLLTLKNQLSVILPVKRVHPGIIGNYNSGHVGYGKTISKSGTLFYRGKAGGWGGTGVGWEGLL